MRIEHLTEPLRNELIKKIESEKKVQKGSVRKDQVRLSDEGQRLSETAKNIDTVKSHTSVLPEVRAEKLAEVREKISSGYYNTEAFIDQLAEKLTKEFGV
jgi:anti-sigma28 factor (negative regulator of flagellin synthesis)